MNSLFLLVIGMAIVTYIPRVIPMALLSSTEPPPFLKRFLSFIPYTVLSALIFPEILFSTGNVKSAVFGGLIAIILAFLNANLLLVIISGIFGVLFWQMFL
ncbi:AzlD domain-containing protein [Thermohalobacter berrensis]|uniref:Branched-chain amino acid transporter n=1 Tax=Thermohalobacter berrensis TaxID=99594 RepID=A0A419SXV0_9FIRM|nr:AzlD domain-containing protein [Thermohalobacter berrensis]RKD30015.1 branched-chain amino acid transporter [Thermohalobacter berrensis]